MLSLSLPRVVGLVLAIASALLSSCANMYDNSYGAVTHRAWESYTRASPFAYDTPYSEVMFSRLSRDIRAIPLEGVDVSVREHLNETVRWCEKFPSYHRRAVAAYNAEYGRIKGYSYSSTRYGARAGSMMADRDADFDRFLYSGMGAIIGWSLNEGYAQSRAAAAAQSIMRPHAVQGRMLILREYDLNNRLGHASTYYLKNTVASFRY